MDAHLFRRFCEAALPLLQGARLVKIQEPADGVLTFNLDLFARSPSRVGGLPSGARADVPSGQATGALPGATTWGRKAQLVFRAGRKDPFLFLSPTRMAADRPPSAMVMRLRKYAAGHSIRHLVVRWPERELWLLLSGPMDGLSPQGWPVQGSAHPKGQDDGEEAEARLIWLVLDLREGARLAFLTGAQAPVPSDPAWPTPGELPQALDNWRDWPVLTPALRRTLQQLEPAEAAALLLDLEAGGGDLFLTVRGGEGAQAPASAGAAGSGSVVRIGCWPQPTPPEEGLREIAVEDALDACLRAGGDLVLVEAARQRARRAVQPLERREKHLRELLARQEEDEARLAAMCGRRKTALLLQANLWRWPSDARPASVDFEDFEGNPVHVDLDRRLDIRDNMAKMFRDAGRGERGLGHVAERRKVLAGELEALRRRREAVLAGTADVGEKAAAPSPGPAPAVPQGSKRVQYFLSSDGFPLLRGRDARGNLEVRRMASPHDIWVHAAGGPGAHVIIRRSHAGQGVPDRTLDEAGALAACRSWLREEPKARLTYCEVRHVKPMRGAAPGTMRMDKVLFTREVVVDPSLEEKLAARTQ